MVTKNAPEFRILIIKRLITAKDYKSSISQPIIKKLQLNIAIGMIMMIVSGSNGIRTAKD
jgi:lipoprotein-releasing system permease protein